METVQFHFVQKGSAVGASYLKLYALAGQEYVATATPVPLTITLFIQSTQ
jgi:hypothetical protein